MILDPLLLMTLLLIAAFGLVALFFSPVIVELKKPRDQGPRRISKTPMERRIRNVSRSPSSIEPDQTERINSTIDNQDDLNDVGVKATEISSETLHILEDHTFPPHFAILKDVVVEGSLKISDDCAFRRSVKAKDDVFIGNRVVIEGNLVSEGGSVTVLDNVAIGGSVHSEGFVTIGERVFVALSVVAVGDVELGENSEVMGGIFTRGAVKGPRQTKVEFLSLIDRIE